ncbi:MAG TPA: hypothetical protein VNE62_08925 [Actinomycetota bacterium]|nr:hypothetical protein [Actinomycetota bacterium]
MRGPRIVLLLGAFDPPTRAHVEMALAAGRLKDAEPALCLTSVVLNRPRKPLLKWAERLELLEEVCDAHGLGLAVANRGTYLEVAGAAESSGFDATFLVGSDKIPQLLDPAFYDDGPAGVEATVARVKLLVVGRPGSERASEAGPRFEELPASGAFADPRTSLLSATEVRQRLRDGRSVDDLVPPAVARRLRRYTVRPSDPRSE